MVALLRSSVDAINPSKLSAIKSTTAVTATTILCEQRALIEAATKAVKEDADAEPPKPPMIRSEAIEEADRRNTNNQAVIGTKEGVTEAIVEMVGKDVTDAVLRTVGGEDYKSLDEYELHELVSVIIQGADRPNINDVLDKLHEVVTFKFDFRKKVGANVEALRAKAAQMQPYGIVVDETQIALVFQANVSAAASEDWGREFRPAVQVVRKAFAYNHKHDAASIKTMLKEYAAADAIRTLRDAPAPNSSAGFGTANAVAETMTQLQRMMRDEESSVSSYETAAAARTLTYDSDSSVETEAERGRRKARERKARDKRRGDKEHRARSSSRHRRHGDDAPKWEDNPCKHCRANKRRVQHPHVEEAQCFWNPEYVGWRPESVCETMKLPFRSRSRFKD